MQIARLNKVVIFLVSFLYCGLYAGEVENSGVFQGDTTALVSALCQLKKGDRLALNLHKTVIKPRDTILNNCKLHDTFMALIDMSPEADRLWNEVECKAEFMLAYYRWSLLIKSIQHKGVEVIAYTTIDCDRKLHDGITVRRHLQSKLKRLGIVFNTENTPENSGIFSLKKDNEVPLAMLPKGKKKKMIIVDDSKSSLEWLMKQVEDNVVVKPICLKVKEPKKELNEKVIKYQVQHLFEMGTYLSEEQIIGEREEKGKRVRSSSY